MDKQVRSWQGDVEGEAEEEGEREGRDGKEKSIW